MRYLAIGAIVAHLAVLGMIAWELDEIRSSADDTNRNTWKLYHYRCDDGSYSSLCYH